MKFYVNLDLKGRSPAFVSETLREIAKRVHDNPRHSGRWTAKNRRAVVVTDHDQNVIAEWGIADDAAGRKAE